MWIATASGRKVQYPGTDPHSIRIEDIANNLSRMPRWAGCTREPVSVAQHSINCSAVVPPEHQLQALLHDATEAYIGDLPKPFKEACPEFKVMEDDFFQAIALRFGVLGELSPEVKEADVRMLKTESVLFLPDRWKEVAVDDPFLEGLEPYDSGALALPNFIGWRLARTLFLERFKELSGEDYDLHLLP